MNFDYSMINTILLTIILFLIILVFVYFYLKIKNEEKKIKEIESTYKYLQFLDNANQRLYEKYLKEKTKNKKS